MLYKNSNDALKALSKELTKDFINKGVEKALLHILSNIDDYKLEYKKITKKPINKVINLTDDEVEVVEMHIIDFVHKTKLGCFNIRDFIIKYDNVSFFSNLIFITYNLDDTAVYSRSDKKLEIRKTEDTVSTNSLTVNDIFSEIKYCLIDLEVIDNTNNSISCETARLFVEGKIEVQDLFINCLT
jgi:hypothetical protein